MLEPPVSVSSRLIVLKKSLPKFEQCHMHIATTQIALQSTIAALAMQREPLKFAEIQKSDFFNTIDCKAPFEFL
jgi:hypothetical protein